jgi:hypothetical protein
VTALAWTITATVWAGPLALAGIWVLNRVSAWHHSHGRSVAREPKEAPPSTATAARPWRLPMFLVRNLVGRRGAAPEPGEHHEGATEDFGDELHALRDAPLSPELEPVLSEVEIRADVHDDLDQIMRDFRHDLDHILDGVCRRLDPYWTPVAVGELAGVTG